MHIPYFVYSSVSDEYLAVRNHIINIVCEFLCFMQVCSKTRVYIGVESLGHVTCRNTFKEAVIFTNERILIPSRRLWLARCDRFCGGGF